MSIALWCVLFAAMLPYIATGIAKRSGGNYNNRHPREWAAKLEGFSQRAYAAHFNSFEFFPFFAIAVLFAEWKLGGGGAVDRLALAIIGARIAYLAAYLSDRHILRSLFWALAFIGTIGLFIMGGMGK